MTTPNFDLKIYNRLLRKGLPSGLGTKEHACIMGALNLACGGELSDAAESPCVLPAARRFLVRLNDARWSSEATRAKGMRALGLAALGTDKLDGKVFASRLVEATIRRVVPLFLRRADMEADAERCETEGTREAAISAKQSAWKKHGDAAADAAANAADAAAGAADADAADAADAANAAAYRAKYGDETLILSAKIATKILIDLKAGK